MTCKHSRQTTGHDEGLLPCAFPRCPEGRQNDTYVTYIRDQGPSAWYSAAMLPPALSLRTIAWKRESIQEAVPKQPGLYDETTVRSWYFWRALP